MVAAAERQHAAQPAATGYDFDGDSDSDSGGAVAAIMADLHVQAAGLKPGGAVPGTAPSGQSKPLPALPATAAGGGGSSSSATGAVPAYDAAAAAVVLATVLTPGSVAGLQAHAANAKAYAERAKQAGNTPEALNWMRFAKAVNDKVGGALVCR